MNPPPLGAVHENVLFDRWGDLLARRPDQTNRLHETDAEIVPIQGTELLLAFTVDTVSEEIEEGFYTEPETIGWMGATVALSDLAAVGASPVGILTSVSLPRDAPASFQEGVARGLNDACRAADCYVLGGDTNVADRPTITGCAAGIVQRDRLLTRIGCVPGDFVYATGLLGAGAAAAARAVMALPPEIYAESDYRPRARVHDAQLLTGFVTACMDTSDGLISTLDQLMRLNGVGFHIETSPLELLEPHARGMCVRLGIPPLGMLAALHGEFELVFTVPEGRQRAFDVHTRDRGFSPICLGRVVAAPTIHIAGRALAPDETAHIRNLIDVVDGDLGRYLAEMLRIVGSD